MEIKPELFWGLTAITIGLTLAIHGCALLIEWFEEWRYINNAGAALEQKLILPSDERVKRAVYNPKPMRQTRLTVADEEYDPSKHFRCEVRVDRRW